ncbi:MAG: hypothetical protein ACK6DY_20680 [Acidobacteriota bacterium]
MQAAGLSTGPNLYLAREYRTGSNGVTHLACRQRFQGLEVYQSEWVVNIDANGHPCRHLLIRARNANTSARNPLTMRRLAATQNV